MEDNMKNCRIFFVVMLLAFLFGCGNSQGDKQLTIESFTEALESNGISIGKKSEKMYRLLMATDGYGIDVNGEYIEVYQFDTTIQSGKDAIEKWKKEGFMGQPVIVNKNLMMFADKKHKDWKEIFHIFNSL